MHVTYKGRVQGVGFRFTAESIAQAAGVFGWVRNRSNGDVELMLEGSQIQIDEMLRGITESSLGPYIQKTIKEEGAFRGEFSSFRIEFIY